MSAYKYTPTSSDTVATQGLQGDPFIIICSHICGHPVTMTYDYPRRHVLHPLNKLIRHECCSGHTLPPPPTPLPLMNDAWNVKN